MLEKRLQHRLRRLIARRDYMEKQFKGKERDHTFHAGYSFGYVEAQIHEIEEQLDELNS